MRGVCADDILLPGLLSLHNNHVWHAGCLFPLKEVYDLCRQWQLLRILTFLGVEHDRHLPVLENLFKGEIEVHETPVELA